MRAPVFVGRRWIVAAFTLAVGCTAADPTVGTSEETDGLVAAPTPAFPFSYAKRGCTQEDLKGIQVYLKNAASEERDVTRAGEFYFEVRGASVGSPLVIPIQGVGREQTNTFARAGRWVTVGTNIYHHWLLGTLHYEQDAATLAIKVAYDMCDDPASKGSAEELDELLTPPPTGPTCFSGSAVAEWRDAGEVVCG